jgi:hypothetical protein
VRVASLDGAGARDATARQATAAAGGSDCERRVPGAVAVAQNAAMALVMLRRRRTPFAF